jgi:hypothetical protein
MPRLAVTGTRGVAELLRAVGHRKLEPSEAVAAGVLHQEKVEGVWAYSTSEAAIVEARTAMRSALPEVCDEWLLVPSPIATAGAAKRITNVDLDRSIAQALVRELIRSQAIGSLPLLTEEYAPYFALYSWTDQDEIDHYLSILSAWTQKGGEYCSDDLPSPRRERSIQAWRERVFLHGEFLGLGCYQDGVYVAYKFQR